MKCILLLILISLTLSAAGEVVDQPDDNAGADDSDNDAADKSAAMDTDQPEHYIPHHAADDAKKDVPHHAPFVIHDLSREPARDSSGDKSDNKSKHSVVPPVYDNQIQYSTDEGFLTVRECNPTKHPIKQSICFRPACFAF